MKLVSIQLSPTTYRQDHFNHPTEGHTNFRYQAVFKFENDQWEEGDEDIPKYLENVTTFTYWHDGLSTKPNALKFLQRQLEVLVSVYHYQLINPDCHVLKPDIDYTRRIVVDDPNDLRSIALVKYIEKNGFFMGSMCTVDAKLIDQLDHCKYLLYSGMKLLSNLFDYCKNGYGDFQGHFHTLNELQDFIESGDKHLV